MTVTPQIFRANFAEFGNTATYPDSAINYWIGVSGRLLNMNAWGNMLDDGTQLFVAHNLSLEAQAVKQSKVGGQPGVGTGPVASKAVDKVNISYDTASAIEKDAGHWNLTIYGTRFIRLAKMMGAGGLQITGGCSSSGSGSCIGNLWGFFPYPFCS